MAGDVLTPDARIPTHTRGIVLHHFARCYRPKMKRAAALYQLAHEPSDTPFLGRARTSMKAALADAAALGDLRWKGKPFDWTQPADAINNIERARLALYAVSGFVIVSGVRDKELLAWGERNNVKVAI